MYRQDDARVRQEKGCEARKRKEKVAGTFSPLWGADMVSFTPRHNGWNRG